MFEASGKYRLDARLGGGGMAEVFVASALGAEGFARRVAIKRVLPGFSDNPQFSQMFVDEARISSRLVHPNIVSVLDFDRDLERRLFLVMELVEGKDLDALASTGLLPFPVVAFIIAEVLRGLGYAHDLPVTYDASGGASIRGIVHRDVSPHNVLLSWEGAVKVSDFGIAKARAASEATASVFIKGKPAYMSPEQANGEALDGRSDLFAVGIMMWEMLVGRRLFTGEDTRATLAAVLFGQIPRPRSLRADVPKDLDRVTMKLLERDLPVRYATAEQALADLLICAAARTGGREATIALLAERFVHQAPVRHSVMASRAAASAPAQPQALPQVQVQISSGVPEIVDVSADTAVSGTSTYAPGAVEMPTTSRGAPGASRGKGSAARIAMVGVGAVVAGLVAFVVVRSVVAPAGSGSGSGSGSVAVAMPGQDAAVAVDAAPPVSADAPVDAPPPVVADAAPPVDAAPPADAGPAPQKDAHTATPAQVGTITVKFFPISKVFIDGHYVRESPVVGYSVPVGHHTVRIVNTDAHVDLSQGTEVTANHETTVDLLPK